MAFFSPGSLTGAEVENHFQGVYGNTVRTSSETMSRVMEIDVPSTHAKETWGYIEAAPHVELWIDAIPEEAMGSKTLTVVNHKYGKRVKWKTEDRADEMTGSLMTMVEGIAESAGLLDERFFYDLIAGGTSTLPATVNAADGVALFSATDGGGGARFDVTGGNIVTGGTIATGALVRADVWNGVRRFREMQDGKGQYLHGPERLKSFTILAPSEHEEVFREAIIQGRTLDGGAAVTNTIGESGLSLHLEVTPRLTGDDWYMSMDNSPQRSIFSQLREGLDSKFADSENSDMARDFDVEYMQVRLRKSAGIILPYDIIKINN